MITKPICRIFAFSCLFSLVLSCEKSTNGINSITYPLVVRAKSLESQGAVRLFNKDGEITDAASVARFTKNANIDNVPVFDGTFEWDENNKITFLSKDSLMFANEPLKYGVNESTNGGFLISRDFKLTEYPSLDPRPSDLEIYWQLGAHSLPLNRVLTPSGVILTGKEIRIAYGSPKSFKFPILAHMLKREQGAGAMWSITVSIGKIFDEFNEDFIHTLKNQDTLAIQQNYIRYGE